MVNHPLIRFKSPAHHDILMFGAVAQALIGLMGLSGRVPSALAAEDIPAARARLLAGLEQSPAAAPITAPKAVEGQDDDEAQLVPLARRAIPLLAMLEVAHARQTHVLWEAAA